MTAPDLTPWLDCGELAQLLRVSKDWVQTRVTARELPFHRVGRLVRFSPEDVQTIERSTAMKPVDPRQLVRR